MPNKIKYSRQQRKDAHDLYWQGRPKTEGRPRGDYTLMEIQNKTGVEFRSISMIARGLR